jgi:hypothetical protein
MVEGSVCFCLTLPSPPAEKAIARLPDADIGGGTSRLLKNVS